MHSTLHLYLYQSNSDGGDQLFTDSNPFQGYENISQQQHISPDGSFSLQSFEMITQDQFCSSSSTENDVRETFLSHYL